MHGLPRGGSFGLLGSAARGRGRSTPAQDQSTNRADPGVVVSIPTDTPGGDQHRLKPHRGQRTRRPHGHSRLEPDGARHPERGPAPTRPPAAAMAVHRSPAHQGRARPNAGVKLRDLLPRTAVVAARPPGMTARAGRSQEFRERRPMAAPGLCRTFDRRLSIKHCRTGSLNPVVHNCCLMVILRRQ